jgi:hypothetical protein
MTHLFPNDIAAECVRDHRGMAGQHLGGDVVVAVNSVRRLVESAGVAVGVTGAMKDETVVVRGVEPWREEFNFYATKRC